MSEIFVDTIKNKAGSTSLDSDKLPDMYTGSAKSWVNFNGTGTIATRDSFNVSSLTDISTGKYDVTFSSEMGNDDYSFVTNASTTSGGTSTVVSLAGSGAGGTTLTTKYRIYTLTGGGSTFTDISFINSNVHGDLT
jgi:hypothetical protein